MKLQIAAIITAIALSSAALTPVYAAATATTSAMTAKPKMAAAKTPDPKRFSTEAAAQASCATDTVVWANTRSKIFHLTGTSSYGKGKNGTYMCQTDATAEGFKPTKKPEKVVSK